MASFVGIIGAGARTAVGLNAPATAAAVRAGIAGLAEHPFMLDKESEPMVVCADGLLPSNLSGADRLLALAIPAAQEALAPLRERRHRLPRVAVYLALPEDRPGRERQIEQRVASQLLSTLRRDIEPTDLVCHAQGHAGGLFCLGQAMESIASGRSDICLVGGVDSYIEAETLEWLDREEQLHSPSTIWGFCPGEGAAFSLLASAERATALGLSAPVELLAAGSSNEPNRIKTETVCLGDGLTEAFVQTLADLGDEARISTAICDMNGEPYRANEFGFAVLRTANQFSDDFSCLTPADCLGDVGAASGPLFATLATFAAVKNYSDGPFTLMWASSESGLRSAVLVRDVAANPQD